MKTKLPIEIWWKVFENIDNIADLWALQAVSKTFRKITKKLFKKQLGDSKTCPRLKISLKEMCLDKEILITLVPNLSDEKDNSIILHDVNESGFRGFAKVMVNLYKQISNDIYIMNNGDAEIPTLFRKEEFLKLQKCLKEGWQNLEDNHMSPTLRPAYATLFSHIYRTYDGICNRPTTLMRPDVQMSVSLFTNNHS